MGESLDELIDRFFDKGAETPWFMVVMMVLGLVIVGFLTFIIWLVMLSPVIGGGLVGLGLAWVVVHAFKRVIEEMNR